MVTYPDVNRVVRKFVFKDVRNKDGVFYKTVPIDNQKFMEQFLPKFAQAFMSLFKDRKCGKEIFVNRLMQIDAVRFDDKDQNLMPFKIAFDDMKETCKGNLEGGLFLPHERYGVILLDMDFMSHTKAEAIHTLIHELLHAMSLIKIFKNNKKVYKSGFNRRGRAFNKMNEGIVEYIAQLIWTIMYPTKKCPGIGRYQNEVLAADLFMKQFGDVDQFIEDYFINPVVLEAQMKTIKNETGDSIFDFLKSFDDQDLHSADVQKKYISGIKSFKVDDLNIQ